MLRARAQPGDDLFRWARNEMKRELVLSQSSYAKIAGLQSEVGRVVITRVAGTELEYKRTVNMYKRDTTCAVNNIRREQIKMRMKLGRYVRKLKKTKLEHVKLIKDQKKRDSEMAKLEELHLRLKHEAAAKTPEPLKPEVHVIDVSDNQDDTEDGSQSLSPSEVEFKGGPIYISTGLRSEEKVQNWQDSHCVEKLNGEEDSDTNSSNKQNSRLRKPSTAFNPMLPMIDEDDKEVEEVIEETDKHSPTHPDKLDTLDAKVWDDLSVSSYGGRLKRKNDVSFSDIIKVKYTGPKKMFDLVDKLAKKHGIADVEDKVSDPRDSVVLRGSTNGSFGLQAAVLYPMKYGYNATIPDPVDRSPSKSPAALSVSDGGKTTDPQASRMDSPESRRVRRVSVDSRRSMYLSGKYSKSIDGDTQESVSMASEPSRSNSPRKLRSRDMSMPELVDRVSKIKLDKMDRLSSSSKLENEMISSYNLLAPSTKPSSSRSSRSSRSLPALTNDPVRSIDRNVSWTQALGLLRAIHSLDDVTAD